MIAPVERLSKKEIIWLKTHRCRHRHTYLEHYQCYLEESPKGVERIGFLDIEATNLQATFGFILCYCIKDSQTGKILEAIIKKRDIAKEIDRKVIQKCVDDILKFDRIVTFYGTKFDLPFIRSRALYHGIEFPGYGLIKHKDLYYTVKGKFRLHSNRLQTACGFILGETEKTHFGQDYWIKASLGDKHALEYVLDHCRRDVSDLEKLWNKISHYNLTSNRSM